MTTMMGGSRWMREGALPEGERFRIDTAHCASPLTLRAMELAVAGDHGALDFLFARYADEVYAHARGMLDDEALAARLTGRAFASLEDEATGPDRCGSPRTVLLDRVRRLAAHSALS